MDLIEKAREVAMTTDYDHEGSIYKTIQVAFAALDCLEILRGDLKYPSLNKRHAEAWEKFEEAINE